jgi:bidirectional [NiFe] hydrogenase diaphorase subunit
MSVKTLTIDGKMLTGLAGDSIFTVAWHNDIRIPRLCHVGGVADVGACRLCLVEVEGRARLQAACMTEVEEGMVVHTATEKLQKHRKLLLELLLAEGNHVCAVCVSNGNCELQDLAAELGVDHVRVAYQHPQRQVDLSHPRFGLDLNRCIDCTRCVRTCDDVEGAHVWDMAGRGQGLHLVADLGEPWGESENCTQCGKCVQVCPTGALFTKGLGVGEMEKDRSFLKYIVYGRERHQWIRK